MSSYDITYKCEHEGSVNIVGPEKDRPRKREWLATQLCPNCKKEQAAKSVDEWTEAHGLVALQGSDKQVAWANKIRKELLEGMEPYINIEDEDPLLPYIIQVRDFAASQTTARWWIDQQAHTSKTWLRAQVKQLQAKEASK